MWRTNIVTKDEALLCFWALAQFDTFTRNWDLNGILTVTRFDAFEALFSIWYPFHSTFETLLYWLFETIFSIWHPFGRHLRPYWLFETIFSIWHPFHSTFETLFIIWDPFQHLRPPSPTFETLLADIWDLIRYLRPFFSIWHHFYSTFETLFVIRGPFQHLRPFSFNIWDLYLRPALFSIWHALLAASVAHKFLSEDHLKQTNESRLRVPRHTTGRDAAGRVRQRLFCRGILWVIHSPCSLFTSVCSFVRPWGTHV